METKAPPADEDSIAVASRLRCQSDAKATTKEKTFASLNISRALYTLAALVPQDIVRPPATLLACLYVCTSFMQISTWQEERGDVETTLTEHLLPSLLEVATCTPIQPLSRRLAYLVTAQYMARVNPQVYTWCMPGCYILHCNATSPPLCIP